MTPIIFGHLPSPKRIGFARRHQRQIRDVKALHLLSIPRTQSHNPLVFLQIANRHWTNRQSLVVFYNGRGVETLPSSLISSLAKEINRVPSLTVPLDHAQELRFQRLMEPLIMVDVHVHPMVLPEDMKQIAAYLRANAYRWGYQAVQHGGWTTIATANFFRGLINTPDLSMVEFEDVLQAVGLMLSDMKRQDNVVQIANADGIESDRAFLERYNPDIDREEFEQAWKALEVGGGSRVQTYEPHYEGSSMVLGPPHAVCSAHGAHAFSARPGHHLTPQSLSSGRNVFEALGAGFTLLAFGVEDAVVNAFEQAATSLGHPAQRGTRHL